MAQLDERLQRLQGELSDHERIARHLGLDFERPIRSLGDGYPENTVALVGKACERILKELWRYHNVPGEPGGKALNDLIKACSPFITSSAVIDALRDIQRLRNRSAHDGYEISEEEGLTAVRKLVDVMTWFTTTGSQVLTGDVPRLTPVVARRAEFLAGLYMTLGYEPVKRFELSSHTLYHLFRREIGLRSDYVELVLSRDGDEVRQLLRATDGELLHTEFPKTTRFLILDNEDIHGLVDLDDYRVVSYERFLDTIVDLDAHLASLTRVSLLSETRRPLSADLLVTDEWSGDAAVSRVGDAFTLLAEAAASGGNVLVVGRPGSGKTVLLQRLVAAGRTAAERRYRFYFDLSLKRAGESFTEFATRTLAPCMAVEPSKVFDVFHYFVRSGSVVCAFDGIDEAVTLNTLAGFLDLFTDLAGVLSATSAVVMSSRVSFLEDSPEVRRLIDGSSLLSEQLVQQLHSQGVDPLSIPHFSALRLRGETVPLELQLREQLGHEEPLPDLLWRHMTVVAAQAGLLGKMPGVARYFGRAELEGRRSFPLVDLFNSLGPELFDGAVAYPAFKLRRLFRADGADRVAFVHSAYQELLAGEYLRSPEARAQVAAGQPRLTEQVRAFLTYRSRGTAPASDCVLPAGTYLVGPSHHLMLRQVEAPVLFDRYAVTVRRYNQFLAADSGEWNHPGQPENISHQPWQARLAVQDYYTSPQYADYPAICVGWWSAYALAGFEGKRLPTSLEWEAAARGSDGRLFPWGDDIDLEAVNCADAYAGRPLVSYEAWLEEHDRGALRNAHPVAVQSHEKNRSPFGVHQMAGNVWEFTSTVLPDRGEVVICGGSYDNPYRAVQASSKGLARLRMSSNAVGFRCVQDLA
jgi:hypothetical protein